MPAWRMLPLLGLVSTWIGCAALNYPDEAETPAEGGPAAPVLLEIGSETDTVDLAALEARPEESEQSWYALTRAARLARQTGDFDVAEERLAQAALQLAGRPAANAQRRAVHGMRARLALDFVALRQEEKAEALAETLFEEAEAEPEIGGPATVELVQYYAGARAAQAREAGLTESQLPLMRIALASAEQESASVTRLSLAYEVSRLATQDGDDDLARRAIEIALGDARIVQAANKPQIASLEIFRARIARAQEEFASAELAATEAYRIFDEIDAPSPNRAIGEATLAAILAERGSEERARAILDGALARLEQDDAFPDLARRTVLAEAGRLERALGQTDAAGTFFRRALDVPGSNVGPDQELVDELTQELAALEAPAEVTEDATAEAASDDASPPTDAAADAN